MAEQFTSLTVENLSKRLDGTPVVDDISISVSQGEIVGLLGPNGAGKTTTFFMIIGVLPADKGRVCLNGSDISTRPMFKRARMGIGYLPQESSVFRQLTVEENLVAVLESLDMSAQDRLDRSERLLTELGIFRLRKDIASRLSGGERRKVEIARALATSPTFLLLDEPFSGLDPKAIGGIQDILFGLKEGGIGILLTDHNVQDVLRITDRAYIMYGGRIEVSGTPDELLADERARKTYFGEKLTV